jgi:lipopolysaccharide export system protein LptA
LILCGIQFSFSQQPIQLVHSDSVIGYKIGTQNVRDFVGNVHLRQGNLDLYCGKATHFIDENKAILISNVKITQDMMILTSDYIEYDGNKSEAYSQGKIQIVDTASTLTAKRGIYYFKPRIAHFSDSVILQDKFSTIRANTIDFDRSRNISYAYENVSLENDSLQLVCDSLKYDKKQDISFAFSNVKVVMKRYPTTLYAGYLENHRQIGYTFATFSPVIVYVDSIIEQVDVNFEQNKKVRYDSLWVFADSLFSLRKEESDELVCRSNVRIFRDKFSGIAGFAKYFRNKSYGYLLDFPIVWYDSTEFRGDSITFSLNNNSLNVVNIVGNGRIYSFSRDDSRYINIIQSDTFWIYFNNNKISYLNGKGGAKTSYFLKEETNGGLNLANYVSDSLRIDFFNDEVQNVVWLGNIYGELIPQSVFSKNIETYIKIPDDFFQNKPKLDYQQRIFLIK